MKVDRDLLDELTAKAKVNPRHRMHYDLRDSEEEGSMRMLNAIEPETVIPVHRHAETSEDEKQRDRFLFHEESKFLEQ